MYAGEEYVYMIYAWLQVNSDTWLLEHTKTSP